MVGSMLERRWSGMLGLKIYPMEGVGVRVEHQEEPGLGEEFRLHPD